MIRIKHVSAVCAVLAIAVVATAGFALAGTGAGEGRTNVRAVTNVTVRAGEYYFNFSQTTVPTGTVVFTVINEGDLEHDLSINGQKTPILTQRRQQATLTVNFPNPGNYGYVCTIGEHAVYGMSGNLTVVQDPNAPPPTTTHATTTTGGGPALPDATIRVVLSEFKIKLTTTSGRAITSIKPGTVRFLVTNVGRAPHDFKIGGKKTPILLKGGKATLDVALAKGTKPYLCTLSGHAALGMKGALRVGTAAARPTLTLRVKLSEFKIRVTTTKGKRVTAVKRGKVRFLVTNVGRVRHDFKIQGRKTKALPRKGKATLVVTLRKGIRPYLCTLPGHAALGMRGKLRVT